MTDAELILGEVRVLRAELREDVSKIHSKLDTVHEQTTKTNGRVTRLEGREVDIDKAVDYVKKCNNTAYAVGHFLITVSVVSGIVSSILIFFSK